MCLILDSITEDEEETHAVLPSDRTLADVFGSPRQLLKHRNRKSASPGGFVLMCKADVKVVPMKNHPFINDATLIHTLMTFHGLLDLLSHIYWTHTVSTRFQTGMYAGLISGGDQVHSGRKR